MKPLPRVVIIVGWVSLLTDVASEMIYPVVPLFLMTLTASGGTAVGLIEGLAEALVSVMKGLSGWHSDRAARRVPYVRWGYGLSTLARPLMALAWSWNTVLLARLLDRFGKGLRTSARDALLADAAEPGETGRVFGYHRGMDTAGALAGVLIAAFLLARYPGQYRFIFTLGVVPAVAAFALTAFLREPHASGAAVSTGSAGTPFSLRFWVALAALVLFGVANSSDAFLIMRARNLGWSDSAVLLTYALYNLIYAVVSYPAGRLSDRIGRWPLLAVGWVLYAFVYLGFALASKEMIVPLFGVYGLYMAMTEGVGKALIADLAPADRKGTALGIVYMGVGFATLTGSVAAGVLWDRVGPAAPFWLGSGAAVVALLTLGAARLAGNRSMFT